MPKPFDATLKDLIRAFPADWLAHVGVTVAEPPEVLSAELSAVTAAADTLIRVGGLVVHIDVESGPDPSLARRMLLYNVLAHHHTGLPVRSVVVLLRSNATRAAQADRLAYERLTFGFDVLRVWERPADDFLRGPLGLLPLAVLGRPPAGATRAEALPGQVERIVERAKAEAGSRAPEMVTSAFILGGIHNEQDVLRSVFVEAMKMIESSAFQVIEDLAMERQTRNLLLRMGTIKFGEPTDEQKAKLMAIENLARLDRLAVRLIKVESWDALLRGR
ncbi:MAG TPA: hypothetical protein VD866_10565 [Urbifossiella sp.]|nr:hypothetical protein [Urbifossiella sp.]